MNAFTVVVIVALNSSCNVSRHVHDI